MAKFAILRTFIVVTITAPLLFGCNNDADRSAAEIDSLKQELKERDSVIQALRENSGANPALAKENILPNAKLIVAHISAKEFDKLADFVSPDLGLSFSPQSYIAEKSITFKNTELPALWSNDKKFAWGEEDGSGKSIHVPFKSYYASYIYTRDFVKAKEIVVGKLAQGNTTALTNFPEKYPGSVNVDFYFPNTSEENYDWETLRLIFVNENGNWWLRHIMHVEYSI